MEHKKHHHGLTDQQVKESRVKNGANILTPPKRESLWKLFLEKFEDPIIRILLIAAFLSLGISYVHGSYAETIGIFIAILLATVIAFWFEMDANKKFDILNQVNDDTLIKVIRKSNICEVAKKDIVVGDIVVLESGEEVPADGELLEAVSLLIDESCLTGEPPIDKTTNPSEFNKEATYPSNCAMRGTKIVDGHAIVEINKVGDNTEYGKVAEKAAEMTGEETPLNKQLDVLAKFIGVVGFALAVFTFLALFIKDFFFGDVHFDLSQLGSIGIVILAAMVALIKVWLPIIYDTYELLGIEKEVPKSVEEGGWLKWIGFGFLTFIVLVGLGFALGINPLVKESWVGIEAAGRILTYFMVAVTLIVVALL
jgi:Ca2+-transporting ATPase